MAAWRTIGWLCGIAALAHTPAGAATRMDFVFTGTVADLLDPTGMLGTASPGDPFILTYHADFTRGIYANGGGGSGGGSDLYGGASQAPRPGTTVLLSPVSATLVVGGRRLTFSGADFGEAQYVHTALGPGIGRSAAQFTARDRLPSFGGPLDAITASIESSDPRTFAGALTTPRILTIDGSLSASASFAYGVADAAGREPLVSGTLRPLAYSAAFVPEPATWTLLLVGFGLVGLAQRRTKKARAVAGAGLPVSSPEEL